jgi:hypothetical protein
MTWSRQPNGINAFTNKCLASFAHLVESAGNASLRSRPGTTKQTDNDMKLFALLTLAISLVLVGCEKSSETAPPATNAPAAPK